MAARGRASRAQQSESATRRKQALGLVEKAKAELHAGRNFEEVLELYNEACSLMPTVSRYFFLRGNLHKAMGRWLLAHFDYAEAIKQSKSRRTAAGVDPDYYCARGLCFRKMGSLREALGDLNNAIHLKHDNGTYYFQRGLVHFQAGDYAAAEKDFTSSIKYHSQTYRAYFNRANCRRKLGDPAGAIDDLRQATTVDPTAPAAHNALGLALCEQGDYFGALASVSLACSNAPSNATYLCNRGLVHYHLGNLSEALADYGAAVAASEGGQPDATILFHRGNALLAAGKAREALADLTMAAHLTLQAMRDPTSGDHGSTSAGSASGSRSSTSLLHSLQQARRGAASKASLGGSSSAGGGAAARRVGALQAGTSVDNLPVLEGGANARVVAGQEKVVAGDGGALDPVRAGEGQVGATVTTGLGLSLYSKVPPPPAQEQGAGEDGQDGSGEGGGVMSQGQASEARRRAMVAAKAAAADHQGLTLNIGLPPVQDITVNAMEEGAAGGTGAVGVHRWGAAGGGGGPAGGGAASGHEDDIDLPRVLPTEDDIEVLRRTGEIVVQATKGEGGRLGGGGGVMGVSSLALIAARQQHSLGLAFQALRKYDAALEHFQLALALWGGHAPSRYHAALMLHALGDHDQAEAELGTLLAREADSQRVLEARGLARQAMGRHREAVEDFTAALAVEERGETLYHRGVSHLATKPRPDVQAALRDLRAARKAGFKRGEVYDKVATAFLLQADVPSAIAAYTAALELDPTNLSYLARRSQCHREIGDSAEAEADLSIALSMPHADASLLYLRGLARYDQDKFDEAVEDLHAALAAGVDPATLPDVYYTIGLAHANSDTHDAAEEAFSAALAVNPPPPRKLRLLYLHERAKSRQMIAMHEEAVEDFTEVIALNACNAHAYFRRAFSHKALKQYEQAASDFETARMLQPKNPHLVVNYSALHEMDTIILCAAGEEPAFDDERFPELAAEEVGEAREAGIEHLRDKLARQASLQAGGRSGMAGDLLREEHASRHIPGHK